MKKSLINSSIFLLILSLTVYYFTIYPSYENIKINENIDFDFEVDEMILIDWKNENKYVELEVSKYPQIIFIFSKNDCITCIDRGIGLLSNIDSDFSKKIIATDISSDLDRNDFLIRFRRVDTFYTIKKWLLKPNFEILKKRLPLLMVVQNKKVLMARQILPRALNEREEREFLQKISTLNN